VKIKKYHNCVSAIMAKKFVMAKATLAAAISSLIQKVVQLIKTHKIEGMYKFKT
jgi:hypothetical protein